MSLLGIDVGTTVCKAAAFSAEGRCLAMASREYATLPGSPGQMELDSHEVWQKTREIIAEVAAATAQDSIAALCVSSMGEAMVPVSKSREILGSSILCSDSRGAEYAAALEREMGREEFYRINPNLPGPQYSLPKLLWLREHNPDLFHQADHFLLWGDLVGFMLGADPVTNNSLANRTLLFDLARNDWSDRLLDWSGLSRGKLGRVVPGGAVVGTVADHVAASLGLPRGVQVVAGGHDQSCNALGCGCVEAGKAVCGIGTYECITPAFRKVSDPLRMLAEGLNIEHHVLPELYVAFLYNQAGGLVKWFRDTFAGAEKAAGGDIYARLDGEMPPEPSRLLVLPHFSPPQWPRYIPDTAGVILGLESSSTRGEILKAILECTTLYFLDGIEALRRLGIDTTEFVAGGGGARSNAWLQIKADIFGVPFIRPRFSESGLAGAAMLAGLGTRVFGSPAEAAALFVQRDRVFEPDARRHQLYRAKHGLFRQMFPALQGLLAQARTLPVY